MLAEAAGSSFNTDEGSLGTDVSFRCFAGAGGMFTLQAAGRTLQALALQGKEGLYLEDRQAKNAFVPPPRFVSSPIGRKKHES